MSMMMLHGLSESISSYKVVILWSADWNIESFTERVRLRETFIYRPCCAS
jgi:hypothetical protein